MPAHTPKTALNSHESLKGWFSGSFDDDLSVRCDAKSGAPFSGESGFATDIVIKPGATRGASSLGFHIMKAILVDVTHAANQST